MRNFTLKCMLVLIVFTGRSIIAKAQVGAGYWSYSNPKPFGFYVSSTSFIDDNVGLMVGSAGGIAKTIDGGGTWSYFSYTFQNALSEVVKPIFNEVQFVTPTTAYAVGNNGVMIKSIDGGINWSLINTPLYATGTELYTLFFFDANNGYIAGDSVNQQTSIYHTTNGGSSWTRVTGLPEESRPILKIRFSPNGVGYATGLHNGIWEAEGANSLVWKFDQGVWSDYSIKQSTVFPNVAPLDTAIIPHGWDDGVDTVYSTYSDNVSGLSYANWRSLAIVSDTEVILGAQNNGMLIRLGTSTPTGNYWMLNNGSSYHDKYRPLGSPSMYNMVCRDGVNVAAAGSNGVVIKSGDKGHTWATTEVYTSGPEQGADFNAIDVTPGNRYVVGGSGGVIADSLTNWRKPYVLAKQSGFFSSAGISTIRFLDADNGIAAGDGGTLLITNNGGDTWEDRTTPGFSPWDGYTSIEYLSPTVLYAAASNGLFYKSADKGASFDLLFQEPTFGRLEAIDFISEDTGFMVANTVVDIPDDPLTEEWDGATLFHNIAYRTVDGGLTWDSAANAFPSTPYEGSVIGHDIQFLNKNIGYIVGESGSIYKTTDGGITYVKQANVPASIAESSLETVAIVDENIAYAAGWAGTVIKTTDGGATWVNANNGLPTFFNNFYKILAYDANQVMVFGNGTVYTTRDGGNSWTAYQATSNDFMLDACFAPMTNCTEGVCKKVYVGTSGIVVSGHILKFDSDRVLPVKFSKLIGSTVTTGNQLFWTAFSQEAVTYFEVEGSVNGVSFQKVSGKIYPSSLSYQSYEWLHTNVPEGRYYYRVKVYEQNGAVYYTNIITLNGKKISGWNYQVSNGSLILNNVKAEKGDVVAQVINTSGQVIAAKKWNQNGGVFNDVILLPPTAKGIHVVKIVNGGVTASYKVLLQ